MPAVTPGSGRPIDPGFTSIDRKLEIMMPPVSVCHQLSWNGLPKASTLHTTASGLSGSPTLAIKRSLDRSNRLVISVPTFISILIAVGAVYQTVTFWSCRIRYQRSASNSAWSTINVAPFVSGEIMP